MDIYYTKTFLKAYNKLDNEAREKVKKAIQKLQEGHKGKPLRYDLSGYFSIRISNIRVIYKEINNGLMLITCGLRKNVYGD